MENEPVSPGKSQHCLKVQLEDDRTIVNKASHVQSPEFIHQARQRFEMSPAIAKGSACPCLVPLCCHVVCR